jgi:hypothetical protein
MAEEGDDEEEGDDDELRSQTVGGRGADKVVLPRSCSKAYSAFAAICCNSKPVPVPTTALLDHLLCALLHCQPL